MPPSIEKLSPINAMTNGISTNAGETLRSSAMQLYIAGNRSPPTMQTATVANGSAVSFPCVTTAMRNSAATNTYAHAKYSRSPTAAHQPSIEMYATVRTAISIVSA